MYGIVVATFTQGNFHTEPFNLDHQNPKPEKIIWRSDYTIFLVKWNLLYKIIPDYHRISEDLLISIGSRWSQFISHKI